MGCFNDPAWKVCGWWWGGWHQIPISSSLGLDQLNENSHSTIAVRIHAYFATLFNDTNVHGLNAHQRGGIWMIKMHMKTDHRYSKNKITSEVAYTLPSSKTSVTLTRKLLSYYPYTDGPADGLYYHRKLSSNHLPQEDAMEETKAWSERKLILVEIAWCWNSDN